VADTDITHYGWNWTHHGHHMRPRAWIPISPDKVRETLTDLVKNQRHLCRIWVRRADGSTSCIYWYQRNELTLDTCGLFETKRSNSKPPHVCDSLPNTRHHSYDNYSNVEDTFIDNHGCGTGLY
jgi:hypothetical protein